MPIYTYICENCGHSFNERQGIMEEPFKTCPRCGKRKLRRKMGTGGPLVFKGPGFHENDYKKGK